MNKDEPELSADEIVTETIERTGVVQVLTSSTTSTQVKLRLRITNEARWLHMVTLILREESRAQWNAHICRQYVLHDGRLVYTWNFVLQGDDIRQTANDVCRVFDLICSNIDMFEGTEEKEVKRPVRRPVKPPESDSKPRRHVNHGDLEEIALVGTEGRPVPEVAWNQFRAPGKRKGAHLIGGD
jgi:hypothetical protein